MIDWASISFLRFLFCRAESIHISLMRFLWMNFHTLYYTTKMSSKNSSANNRLNKSNNNSKKNRKMFKTKWPTWMSISLPISICRNITIHHSLTTSCRSIRIIWQPLMSLIRPAHKLRHPQMKIASSPLPWLRIAIKKTSKLWKMLKMSIRRSVLHRQLKLKSITTASMQTFLEIQTKRN